MKKSTKDLDDNRYVTTNVLRKVTAIMLPFYQKIASSRSYSVKWARAVRQADLSTLMQLFHSVVPKAQYASFSTNAIGYFIDFPFPKPIYAYTNATSLRPGTTQFTFNSVIHSQIATAIVPLYQEIVRNPSYAALIVKAVRSHNQAFLIRLIRSKVTTSRLTTIEIQYSGMSLGFRYPGSKYTYYNEFFRDTLF
jgi:hypothetical protein